MPTRIPIALLLAAWAGLAPMPGQTRPAANKARAGRLSNTAGSRGSLDPADWPMYTRDLAGTRYSPLRQINTRNAAQLVPAWNYNLRVSATAEPPSGGGVSPAAPDSPDRKSVV